MRLQRTKFKQSKLKIMKNYTIQDREAGNKIETFATLIEAQKALIEYENEDRYNGNYTYEFYEIVENMRLD